MCVRVFAHVERKQYTFTPLFMTPFIYYSLSHKTTSHKWTFGVRFDGMQHSMDKFSWSKIADEKNNNLKCKCMAVSTNVFPIQVMHLSASLFDFPKTSDQRTMCPFNSKLLFSLGYSDIPARERAKALSPIPPAPGTKENPNFDRFRMISFCCCEEMKKQRYDKEQQ